MGIMNIRKIRAVKNQLPTAKKHTILIVDDERANLDSLRDLLSQKYDLVEAENGREALEIVSDKENQDRIHLIISDQRMPEMTGLEFLQKSIAILPRCKRIIVSGFIDMEAIVDSINKAQIYRFLFKPFNQEELLLAIKQALEIYDLEAENASLIRDLELRAQENHLLASTFKKFVPKQFINRLSTEGIEHIQLGKAQSETITMLFSDIRSFSTFAEKLSPQEVFNFLNSYLARMNKPIHDRRGFIDKFGGDSIMALFDHPGESQHEHAEDAVLAAIGMQEALSYYNQHRTKYGYLPIRTGIGVHTGEVTIGTVGSEERMDSTVLGDNVNLAARLEELTKNYGVAIIVSSSTLRLLKDPQIFKYRELDWIRVRGKKIPSQIYEIYDYVPVTIQRLKKRAGRYIKHGLYLRHTKHWDEAIQAFQKALEVYPDDQAAKWHIQYCEKSKGIELPDDWDGAIAFDEK